MAPVTIRYIVEDVEAAVHFYCDMLDFQVDMHPGPGFAMLSKDELRLALNAVGGPGRSGPADARREGPPTRWLESNSA